MSEYVSFVYFIYLSFLFPSVLPKAQHSNYLPILVVWPVHSFLITLPALPPTILFWFQQTLHFYQFTLYNFEFQHACTCSFSMIFFAIARSQCAKKAQESDPFTQFKSRIEELCRKAVYKLHASRRIRKYLIVEKVKLLANAVINSQFTYAPLI